MSAVLSGGARYEVKMGRTLVYEIQLVDSMGRSVGPNPTGNQAFIVTVAKRNLDSTGDVVTGNRQLLSETVRTPDSDGKIRIVVTNPDSCHRNQQP